MGRLDSIQALRGLASLIVAVSHLPSYLQIGCGPTDGCGWFALGKVGVDIFFVISGFVMSTSTAPMPGGLHNGLVFLWHRLVRIAPLYWAVTLSLAALYLIDPRYGSARELTAELVLRSLFFIPVHGPDGDIRPIVGVGWSLDYEMYFYAYMAIGVALLSKQRLVIVSLCILSVYLVAMNNLGTGKDWVINSGLVIEFIFGMIAAKLYRRVAWTVAGTLAGVVACMISLPDLLNLHPYGSGLDRAGSWGAFAFLVVLLATSLEHSGKLMVLPFLGKIGDASYSLYLTHAICFAAVSRIMGHWHWAPTPAIRMVLLLGTSIMAALLVYRWVERPLTSVLRKLGPASGSP